MVMRAMCAVPTVLFFAASPAAAQDLLWRNPWNSSQTTWNSYVDGPTYAEAADDFDAIGWIDRVIAHGMGPGCSWCPPPSVRGVNVRFYRWTEEGPGTLQREIFVPSVPNFIHQPTPDTLDVRLPEPFHASGRHFVSVQVVFDENPDVFQVWTQWPSDHGNPVLSEVHTRSEPGGEWTGGHGSGVAFALYGTPPGGTSTGTDPCGEWVVVPAPPPAGTVHSRFTGVAGTDQENIWAVGAEWRPSHPTTSRHTLIMHWDGSSWERVPSPDPAECPSCPNNGLGVVAVVNRDDAWAAGTAIVWNGFEGVGANMLVVRWDGSEWSIVPTPALAGGSGGGIADIKVFAEDDVWFVGTQPPPGNAPIPAVAMRWDGSGFELTPVPIVNPASGRSGGNVLYAIDGVAPDDVWAVGATDVNAPNRHEDSQIHRWDGSEWTHTPGPRPGTTTSSGPSSRRRTTTSGPRGSTGTSTGSSPS